MIYVLLVIRYHHYYSWYLRWKDVCKRDMQTVGLREGDEGDRAYWKETIDNHSGDPR